jgi:hypothetical protein
VPSPAETLDHVRELVRRFLRDFPERNRLISGSESDNTDLDLAILLTLDDFNFATIPVIGPTRPPLSLLVLGSALWVLKSAGIAQSRNFLNFSSGGISAVFSDKTAAYQSWVGVLERKYEAQKSEVKAFMNLAGAYGRVFTPYSNLVYYGGSSGYSSGLNSMLSGFGGFF